MSRRVTLLASMAALSLAGCRTGYLADRFIDEEQIIAPQLVRYGFTAEQATCLGTQLAQRLGHADMRALELRARAFRRGETSGLAPRDLMIVADGAREQPIPGELRNALAGCSIDFNPVAVAAAQPGGPAATATVAVPTTPAGSAEMTPTWLNLGAAPSGQSIAIDATSVQRERNARIAWFRMTDPETGQQTLNSYRLRFDCSSRMYSPLAWRRYDEAGAIVDSRDYTAEVAPPTEVEGGTVTEIAFLSLCT
ncbi:MAG: surface-adhesin E family protein [Allosphingosinicella sp.]|uniref:surface-adhesin E family protein n=1 Tax=Allosphingosinicella sp. TaxID=2823234 RepID=UPI003952AB33